MAVRPSVRSAFTLVEMMVVVALLSLIVLALMAVFSSTQRAFRASVTQTDVLGNGRATVNLIASDLRNLRPSDGESNFPPDKVQLNNRVIYHPVNFLVEANAGYEPLTQPLPGATTKNGTQMMRTNVLNFFFILGRNNTTWTGTGYVVDPTNTTSLYPLYRFYAETNIAYSPWTLYNQFRNILYYGDWTNADMSHVMNGVVQLSLRAYDPSGNWISNTRWPYYYTNAMNTYILPRSALTYGESQLFMFSNTVPASVRLTIGVLENRALQRAENMSVPGDAPWNAPGQWQYLQNQSGAVHLFQQRILIPNVDPSAYKP